MDLRKQGYSRQQISTILQSIDMEDYFVNTYGGADLTKFNTMYEGLLINLEGFGPITEETLTALTNMNKATMYSNMINTANQSRQVLATGVLMNNTEQQMTAMLLDGQGGLTKHTAGVLANTMLNTYSRSVGRLMAERMPENTKYYYDGPVDEKTRPVCIAQCASGYLTMKEIDERFPGAFSDGGGWNCRHRWIMVTRSGQGEQAKAKKFEENLKETPLTLLQQAEQNA